MSCKRRNQRNLLAELPALKLKVTRLSCTLSALLLSFEDIVGRSATRVKYNLGLEGVFFAEYESGYVIDYPKPKFVRGLHNRIDEIHSFKYRYSLLDRCSQNRIKPLWEDVVNQGRKKFASVSGTYCTLYSRYLIHLRICTVYIVSTWQDNAICWTHWATFYLIGSCHFRLSVCGTL